MPRPLIPVEVIYERALALLDAKGADALSARRLAADLGISTRTLYQQVGTREKLIRTLVAQHFSQLQLDFHEQDDWRSTALQWCLALHDTLWAHPFLTELMTIADREAVTSYVDELFESMVRAGISRPLAVECCRALVTVTINHTIIEVRALREPRHSPQDAAEAAKIAANFPMTIRWILDGVNVETSSTAARPAAVRTAKPARSRPARRLAGPTAR
jgi:AcrR family transcriptional regulator